LAAKGFEGDVANVLADLLASKERWDDQTVSELVQPPQGEIPTLEPGIVNLTNYDQLLGQEVSYDFT